MMEDVHSNMVHFIFLLGLFWGRDSTDIVGGIIRIAPNRTVFIAPQALKGWL